MKESIETILIRGISIISKFLLLFFLVRVLRLEDYSGYQLITCFSFIFMTVFELEYYNSNPYLCLVNETADIDNIEGFEYAEYIVNKMKSFKN